MTKEYQYPDDGVSWFRFEPPCTDRLETVNKRQIYLCDPSKFNDPFELNKNVRRSSIPKEIENQLRLAVMAFITGYPQNMVHSMWNENIFREFERWASGAQVNPCNIFDEVKSRSSGFGVQCFSKEWNIPLSWSHYAEKHKGFSVEYKCHAMTMVSSFAGKMGMYDVLYVSELPEVYLQEIIFFPRGALSKLVATKDVIWSYEKEVRIVHYDKKSDSIPLPDGLEVRSLIAGLAADEYLIEKLKEVAGELRVDVWKVVRGRRTGTFELKSLWTPS